MNFLFLLRETGAVIRRRPIATIAFSAMFVIGIMCGILIDKPSAIECYYLNYCDNYIYRIFSESPGGIFLDRLRLGVFSHIGRAFRIDDFLCAVTGFFGIL